MTPITHDSILVIESRAAATLIEIIVKPDDTALTLDVADALVQKCLCRCSDGLDVILFHGNDRAFFDRHTKETKKVFSSTIYGEKVTSPQELVYRLTHSDCEPKQVA